MASITLTSEQWRKLRRMPSGAPAGGSVVIDVTTGVLTVTKFPLANGAGTAQDTRKAGSGGEDK